MLRIAPAIMFEGYCDMVLVIQPGLKSSLSLSGLMAGNQIVKAIQNLQMTT